MEQTQQGTSAQQECPDCHALAADLEAHKRWHSRLVHDIAIAGFIRGDHGYWAAQLLEPYVEEEVSWAIRYHQAMRFFPDEI